MLELKEEHILRYFHERREKELGKGKAFFVFPSIRIFSSSVSTNSELKDYLKYPINELEGTVFLTDYQTAGRGRQGRSFFSPKSMGLYFSILSCPGIDNANPLLITTHAAVAVKRAIQELYGIDLSIKWVNDLYIKLNDFSDKPMKKVCGILAEGKFKPMDNKIKLSSLEYCIMGIGLNLFTPEEGYPKELQDIAASIFGKYDELRYKSFDRNKLIATILFHYFNICEEKEVLEEYRKENLVLGKRISFNENSLLLKGEVLEISKKGELKIRLDNGEERLIQSGEVHLKL